MDILCIMEHHTSIKHLSAMHFAQTGTETNFLAKEIQLRMHTELNNNIQPIATTVLTSRSKCYLNTCYLITSFKLYHFYNIRMFDFEFYLQ